MGVKKIKIVHQRSECIGCNSCVIIAPQCWSMNPEDGKANLRGPLVSSKQGDIGTIDEDEIPANQEAAAACPMRIIRLHG